MEDNKVLTYAELKEFCNNLSEEQLTQTVKIFLSDNEQPSGVNFIEELGAEHYYFPDLEYSCTKADFDSDEYSTIEDAMAAEEHYITPANRVYLHSIDG